MAHHLGRRVQGPCTGWGCAYPSRVGGGGLVRMHMHAASPPPSFVAAMRRVGCECRVMQVGGCMGMYTYIAAHPATHWYLSMMQERPTSLPAPKGTISTAFDGSDITTGSLAFRLDMAPNTVTLPPSALIGVRTRAAGSHTPRGCQYSPAHRTAHLHTCTCTCT